ncbi:MAG: MFS transporter [Bacteroidaceae bacterium]|nr:MFS transporter [Bacteroidaceae bacterium]
MGSPFQSWVPKPLGIVILLLLFTPVLGSGGAFSCISTELYSSLGIISEHIQFANFMVSIGMSAFGAFFLPYSLNLRPKLLLTVGYTLLILFNGVCALTDQMMMLAVFSFGIGILKLMMILCILFTLLNYLAGKNIVQTLAPGNEPKTDEEWEKSDTKKIMGQAVAYLFFMIYGQLDNSFLAWLTFEYDWKMMYVALIGILLICLLIVTLTMRFKSYDEVPPRKYTFHHFGNLVSFGIGMACLCYILVYGKTYDWFANDTIRLAAIIGTVAFAVMLFLDRGREGRFLVLRVLHLHNVRWSMFLYASLMFLMCSSMCVTVFMQIGMKCDNWQTASLGNWALPGYILGAITVIILRKKGCDFRWMHLMGFIFIGLSALYMYFEVQNEGLYERMKYPTMIRAYGMFFLYVLSNAYAFQRTPARFFSSWVCIMLAVRAVIGPSLGAAFYSNALQHRQQHYIERLASDYDRTEIASAQAYQRTALGMQHIGKSNKDAENMAALSTKGKVQKQAMLLTIKDLAGVTIWLCIACGAAVLIYPYRKRTLQEVRRDIEK